MTPRLLEAGYLVHVHDAADAAIAPAAAAGAQPAGSVKAVADRAHTVLLSLPTPDIVLRVCTAPGGLLEGAAVRRVIDFSTIGPRTAAAVAGQLALRGIAYIDAPVSGGVVGATKGSLAIMVACAAERFAEVEPLLRTFGKPFHLGDTPGQAQTMKLANNLLAAAALVVTSEAMVMGVKAGLDPRVMIDVFNTSSGRNSATQDKFPRAILPGSFDFGFTTGLSCKDVRMCIDEAEAMGVPLVAGAAIRQMLAVTQALPGADSDFTHICKVLEQWAGVEVRG